MPAILAPSEAEIRRIVVQGQPGQNVHKSLSQLIKARLGWVLVAHHCNPTQLEGLEKIFFIIRMLT
jgi:hypothetical protein